MIDKDSDNRGEESQNGQNPSENSEKNSKPEDAIWSISAVSRMTRLSQHTLRAWERRFGTPVPVRLPSGHRRFTQDQVEHLQMIAKALRQGHRAGDIVPLEITRLKEILSVSEPQAKDSRRPPSWVESIIEKAMVFDRKGIAQELLYSSANMGIRNFIREKVGPLLETLGDAWREGRIDVRHEHFVSEMIEDILRSLRMPLESKMSGAPILLATLADEHHSLGMQMAALTIALTGRQLRILGANTPLNDIIAATTSLQPLALGLSVSVHTATDETTERINRLRATIPSRTFIWVGGAGAAFLNGLQSNIQIVRTLDDLERILDQLPKK